MKISIIVTPLDQVRLVFKTLAERFPEFFLSEARAVLAPYMRTKRRRVMVVCATFTVSCRSETAAEFTEVREVGVDIDRRHHHADTSESLFDD
jgi:hypothetical protein